jgi:AcrR family transcriptional regulator
VKAGRNGREGTTATGLVPGRKGQATRARLLAEVEKRCLVTHHRNVTVNDIAEAAGTSPATFYHYFPDVATAVAEVATNQLADFDVVLHLAREVVRRDADMDSCRDLVAGYFTYWESRPGLLMALAESAVDEDPRFFRVLLRALFSLTHTLAPAIRSGSAPGIAGSLIVMMTQSAARRDGFARDGVPYDALIDSQARIIRAALSVPAPDPAP